MRAINVLSLFDGCSGGNMALERCGIKVGKYYASEIEKQPMVATSYNYPNTIQLGNVCNVKAAELDKIDLIIGGSPCQGFSRAGKMLNFDDPRSKLFFEFVRLWKECRAINPDVKFMLENVDMQEWCIAIISEMLGVFPVKINSARVSAQNRVRLYWTNIRIRQEGLFGEVHSDIPQPPDKGILLRDILQPESEIALKFYLSEAALARIARKDSFLPQVNPDKTGTINTKNNSGQLSVDNGTTLIGVTNKYGVLHGGGDKSNCVDANYHKGMDNHSQRTMIAVIVPAERGALKFGRTDEAKEIRRENMKKGKDSTPFQAKEITGVDVDKMNTITCGHTRDNLLFVPEASAKGHIEVSPGECFDAENITSKTRRGRKMDKKSNAVMSKQTDFMQYTSDFRIRRLTPIEVCRLQTIPDGYFYDKEGKNLISDSAIYKAVGNGWTVQVIAHIFSFFTL